MHTPHAYGLPPMPSLPMTYRLKSIRVATALALAAIFTPLAASAFNSEDIIATASSSAHLWVMTKQGLLHCSQTSCNAVADSPTPTKHLSAQGSSLWAVTGDSNNSTPWFCTFSKCNQMPTIKGKLVSVEAASASAWIVTSTGIHFCDTNSCQTIIE